MIFQEMVVSILLPGELFLMIFAFDHASAIVTKPLVFPSDAFTGGQQVVGIITGPSSINWSPSVSPSSYYLNRDCQTDNDCNPSRTLLYCITYRCQCITGGATHLNGIFYNYNMEWSQSSDQCISQVGSPCTLRRYWYLPSIIKMDCVNGNECVEITTAAAKATIAAQAATGFGSAVSNLPQNYPASPLHHDQNLRYFGSGVSSLAGNVVHARQAGISATASDSTENSWGICVRRGNNNDGISGELSGSSGTSNSANTVVGLSSTLACVILGLSVVFAWCST